MGRKSNCSKTNYDVTMYATKIDYYCHIGLIRPCYNAQIGISDGIIVNADLFRGPANAKLFILFMERCHEFTGKYLDVFLYKE